MNISGTDKITINPGNTTFSNNIIIPNGGMIKSSDSNGIQITNGDVIILSTNNVNKSTATPPIYSGGALQVSGGCYVAQDLYIGGDFTIGGQVDFGDAVFGDITATNVTAGNYYTDSDYRIKDNVTDLTDSFTVDNLRPVSYVHKDTEKPSIGFIAHEVQEQFPELVTGEKDGDDTQTLNYIGLIGVLVKEIQDLKARVNELEKSN